MESGQASQSVNDWKDVSPSDDWRDVSASTPPSPSPSLLASRQIASKIEADANLPESTIGTRAREAAIGLLEPFDLHNVPSLVSGLSSAFTDAITGKGTAKAQAAVKGLLMAPVRPIVNIEEGFRTGDYDRAAYGAGGFASQTAPAILGGVESAQNAITTIAKAASSAGIPEALMTRAANATASTVAPSAVDAVGNLVSPKLNVARNILSRARAPVYEAAARALSSADMPPLVNAPTPESFNVSGVQPPAIVRGLKTTPAPEVLTRPPLLMPDQEVAAAPFVQNVPKPMTPTVLDADREAWLQQQRIASQVANESPFERGTKPEAASGEPLPFSATPELEAPAAPARSSLTEPDVNKWMGVAPKEVMSGAHPGQRLIDENLISPTKATTKANVDAALDSAGKDMHDQLQAATKNGTTIDASDIVQNALTNATKKIGSPREGSFQATINGILDDITGRYPNLDSLTPEQAHGLKVELGDSAKFSGTAYDDPINQTILEIYRGLNGAIKSNVKGIGPAQSRWQDLYISSRNLADSLAENQVGKGSGQVPVSSAPPVAVPLEASPLSRAQLGLRVP